MSFQHLPKLGAAPPKYDARTIPFRAMLNLANLPPLPDSFDLDVARGIVSHKMYLNDQIGDCVVAATANQVRNFENYEEDKDPVITDEDVRLQYFKETGGPDNGLIVLDHMNRWRKEGFLASGKTYKIYAFTGVDWKHHEDVRYCVYLLNGIFLTLALPVTAQSQAVWDVVDASLQGNSKPGSWGYHAVLGQSYPASAGPQPPPPKPGCFPGAKALALFAKPKGTVVAVNEIGPTILTWGKRVQVTWAWWDTYVVEAFGVVDDQNSWCDPATDPVDTGKLKQMLDDITA